MTMNVVLALVVSGLMMLACEMVMPAWFLMGLAGIVYRLFA